MQPRFVTGSAMRHAIIMLLGACGKQDQGVPADVGQPTLRIDRLTVGDTAA